MSVIEREAVRNMLENAQIISDGVYSGYCTEDIDIDSIPDAEPETSQWIWDEDGMDWGLGAWKCLSCGCRNANLPNDKSIYPYSWSGTKFCPNCGKKMQEHIIK